MRVCVWHHNCFVSLDLLKPCGFPEVDILKKMQELQCCPANEGAICTWPHRWLFCWTKVFFCVEFVIELLCSVICNFCWTQVSLLLTPSEADQLLFICFLENLPGHHLGEKKLIWRNRLFVAVTVLMHWPWNLTQKAGQNCSSCDEAVTWLLAKVAKSFLCQVGEKAIFNFV